jgi:hypothetical protein
VPARCHLAANLLELRVVQHACCGRKHVVIFNRDVTPVQGFEMRQMLTKFLDVRRRKMIVGNPPPAELVDGGVMALRLVVIVFE